MSLSFASFLSRVLLLQTSLQVSISAQLREISTYKFSTDSFAEIYFYNASSPMAESNFTNIFIFFSLLNPKSDIILLLHAFKSLRYVLLSILIFNCQTQIIMGNQVPKKGQQPPAKQTPPEASEKQKDIKIQKTINLLDKNIKLFEDKEKKFEVVVEQLRSKAKQLILMGKKNDAKKYVEQATRYKKQSQNYSIRRKVMQNQKFRLQTARIDKETVNTLESAQQHFKDQQKVNQKLEEVIFQNQQQKMVQDQLNGKLKDLAQDDEMLEQVDDMMAEIERELNKEKGQKIPQKTVSTNVNVEKQKQKQGQEDEISKMMAEL